MSVSTLSGIRDRILPMLEVTASLYAERVPRGYPNILDQPAQGLIGLEIDSSHALFISSDGTDTFAEIYRRNSRTDNRAGAGWQKHGGVPFNDRRPLAADTTDQELRNLIAELMSYFNVQPGLLYITDD